MTFGCSPSAGRSGCARSWRAFRLFVYCAPLLALVSCGMAGSGPVPRLLSNLAELQPEQIGTDRQGQVWAFDRDSGRAVVFDSDGGSALVVETAKAGRVDVDARWGVVYVEPLGRTLGVVRPDGSEESWEIPDLAKGVAWIDRRTVAVGLGAAEFLVQVWDVEAKIPLHDIGPVPEIVEEPGTRPVRTAELSYRLPGQLYWLDSFSGELRIFELTGETILQVAVEDPERERFDKEIEIADRAAKETGEVQRPGLWRFHLVVDRGGTAYVVEACDDASGEAKVLRAPLAGAPERVKVDTPCCSRTFSVQGDHLIFVRPPLRGVDSCNGSGRLP